VVEFNDNVAANQTTTTPLLIVDEMWDSSVKNKLLNEFKGVEFVSVETDSLVVDAAFQVGDTVSKPQAITKQLKGFNNKTLNRMFVVKAPSVTVGADTIRTLGSQLYFNETDNIRVNGRNLLVGNGLDTPAKSLAALTDTYGTCNSYLNTQTLPLGFNNQALLAANELNMLRLQDYRCFRIGERVLQLDYQFGRLGVFDTDVATSNTRANNSSTTLHFFGEVPKKLQVNEDLTYLIAYN